MTSTDFTKNLFRCFDCSCSSIFAFLKQLPQEQMMIDWRKCSLQTHSRHNQLNWGQYSLLTTWPPRLTDFLAHFKMECFSSHWLHFTINLSPCAQIQLAPGLKVPKLYDVWNNTVLWYHDFIYNLTYFTNVRKTFLVSVDHFMHLCQFLLCFTLTSFCTL